MRNQLSKREYKYRCKIIAENHLKKSAQRFLDTYKKESYKELYCDKNKLAIFISTVSVRIFSIYDMVDVVKSDMSLSKDLITKPRCKIGLDLHCDDFRWLIKEDKAVAPTYPKYVSKEYRMPDFIPPIEITCDTKNPYTIKCSSDCKQMENN